MKYRVSLSSEVASQILSMSGSLEGIREGLGLDFENEVEKTLQQIAQHPHMYQREFGSVRRAVLSRFKQVVFYTVGDKEVTIVEIRDPRREPPDWESRGFNRDG